MRDLKHMVGEEIVHFEDSDTDTVKKDPDLETK